MKIPPVGADLLHPDRSMDRHDEANRRFSQFWESDENMYYGQFISRKQPVPYLFVDT